MAPSSETMTEHIAYNAHEKWKLKLQIYPMKNTTSIKEGTIPSSNAYAESHKKEEIYETQL